METSRTKIGPAEKIARLKEGYEAFNKRDFNRTAERYSKDIVWHFVAGPVRGRDAVIAYAKDQAARLDATLEPHDVIANDEHLVALLTYTIKGKPYKLIHVAHTNDEGNITEAWSFSGADLASAIQQR
ncbi:MAG: hypothetical protein AUH85_07000 [Chloroflexi bacterium 13_1_40CM_4_68_4]|nr:MAG: hypothetical protein AUH85_07000 [Chloroflexi bacterium 13_1_40CM_4_68_4]